MKHQRKTRYLLAVATSLTASAVIVQTYPIDRTHLPVPDPNYPHSTILDARDATPPPRFEVKRQLARLMC